MIINFWISACLLILAALALVVAPLLIKRRNQMVSSAEETNIQQFHEQLAELKLQVSQGMISGTVARDMKTELEKKLLNDVPSSTMTATVYDVRPSVLLSLGLAALVPLLALLLYWQLGAQTELKVAEAMTNHELNSETLLQTLEDWQAAKPDNVQALYLLGGRYLSEGRLDDSERSYRRFYQLSNSDQGAAQLAQVLYLKNNNRFTAEISRLIHEALTRNEFNTTALGMQGIAAFEQQDYAGALAAWDKALSVEDDPVAKQSLMTGINKAREMLGEKVLGEKLLGESVAAVRVMVSLAPELQSLPGDTRVMVFARVKEGSMPLAVKPVLVSDLPREVVLDDSSAMMSGAGKISDAALLDVLATISLSGDVRQADFRGEVKSVRTDSDKVVELQIEPAG